MKVIVNDLEKNIADRASLADLLAECDIPEAGIAVAVNEVVVPRTEYPVRLLSDGDKILIIKVFYGG